MNITRFWDRKAAGYDAQADRYRQSYVDAVVQTRQFLKSTHAVLDFACGTGLVTVQIADSAASVHAIDISPKMIEQARAKCAAQGADNVTFAATTLFDDSLRESSFDVVLAFNILHCLPGAPGCCDRIHRLLKPGGLFISITDCLKDAGVAVTVLIRTLQLFRMMPPHVNLMSRHGIITLIESAGFRILETQKLFEMPPNLFVAAQRI